MHHIDPKLVYGQTEEKTDDEEMNGYSRWLFLTGGIIQVSTHHCLVYDYERTSTIYKSLSSSPFRIGRG